MRAEHDSDWPNATMSLKKLDMDHSRRSALRDIFASMSAGVFATLPNALFVTDAQAASWDIRKDLPTPAPQPSFNHFLALSRLVCRRSELDLETAQKMYALFEAEPWGKEHLADSYSKIYRVLNKKALQFEAFDKDRYAFTEGELWFISHVITTWYLGIYYHESVREPLRVSFEKSLMWKAASDFVTPPGFAEKPYGHWSSHPLLPAKEEAEQ